VVLNYQSNALKFVPRKTGKIKIILQRINDEEAAPFLKSKIIEHYGFDLLSKSVPATDDAYELARPGPEQKLLLSVLDNGIGVKEEDKEKLFKMFSCLSTSRSMNTQGIGLGLVITKMISAELGGRTRMFSKYKKGCVFQASF